LFLLRCSDHRRSQTLLKQDILALGPRGGTPLYSMNASKSTLFLLIINTSSISASSATELIDNKGTYTTHSARSGGVHRTLFSNIAGDSTSQL
jgi:hypothetical protein